MVRAGELRGEVVLGQRYKSFDLVVPDFIRHISGASIDYPPTWATIINLRSYSNGDAATAFPNDLRNLHPLLRSIRPLWVSREGIVTETSAVHASDLWEFPTGRDVFDVWASEHGLKYAESSAGRLLLQIVRSLGGLWGANLIRHVELLNTLNDLAHREWQEERPTAAAEPRTRSKVRSGTIPYDALRGLLGPLHARDLGAGLSPDQHEARKQWVEDGVRNHIDSLVAHDVLRVGLRLQCPHCDQRTWYGLDDLGPTLECERCLQVYPFPAGSPREADWHYRPVGPFAVENFAQGAYAVLLALRFLLINDRLGGMAWSTSFELAPKDGPPLEVDFGIFLGPDQFGPGGDTALILGECKSGERTFAQTDYDRAGKLLKLFPAAALVFCTTREELSPDEKTAIAQIAREGRREVVPERPANLVIVLTRTELESTFPAPMCWRSHARITAEIEGTMNLHRGLLGLADGTQQLHLGMPSMQAERYELFAKDRRAEGGKSESAAAVAPVEQAASSLSGARIEPHDSPQASGEPS